MNLNVLVADDDPNVREIIHLFFEQNQIKVIEATNGLEAIQLTSSEHPDLIILDIMMPEMDGFEVCKAIRKITDVPIIMLSAKGEEFDRVLGLELGADDYVTKPFSPRELVARIKAILRRTTTEPATPHAVEQYTFHNLTVDLKRREISVNGSTILFRPKEFELLVYVIKNEQTVLTREQLLENVWGYDYFGDIRTVDVHINKIREKLHPFGVHCIHTVWGVGYRFEMLDPQGEKSND